MNILVIEDIEETRDLLERLFAADGYQVHAVRTEHEAVLYIQSRTPAVILMSLAGSQSSVVAVASRIRKNADLSDEVPFVLFCIEELPEGCEVEIQKRIYLTRPDNFNQLRRFLSYVTSRASDFNSGPK